MATARSLIISSRGHLRPRRKLPIDRKTAYEAGQRAFSFQRRPDPKAVANSSGYTIPASSPITLLLPLHDKGDLAVDAPIDDPVLVVHLAKHVLDVKLLDAVQRFRASLIACEQASSKPFDDSALTSM